MDPDDLLDQLREYYNMAQDGAVNAQDAIDMAQLFDDLDNWISGGGFLPSEWAE